MLSVALFAIPALIGHADEAKSGEEPVLIEVKSAQGHETLDLLVGRAKHLVTPWPVAGASLTDPKVADIQVVTPELILVSGTGPGTADLLMWGENGETSGMRIEVKVDIERLQSTLASMFPRTDVQVQQAETVAVVRGTLRRAEQAAQLRAYLDSLGIGYVDLTGLPGVQQVQVKVRVAEVSRNNIRSLGVNGFRTGDSWFFGQTLGPSNGAAINPVSIGPPGRSSAEGGAPFVFNQNVEVGPSVSLFGGLPKEDIEVFIQALAENQYLRILAEPNLIALSGEQASFLAGGEFPIPVVQGGGNGAGTSITIEYKEFGVGLEFMPVVVGESNIRLHISQEVSDLTDIGALEIQGFRVPGVVTRKSETAVEMRSGQTFAMAGLIQESTGAVATRIPGLGSLPILGPLFRSVRYKAGETELVVLVTASLVEPLSRTSFPPLPGDEHIVPSDWELYSEGRVEGKPPAKLAFSTARWLEEKGLGRLKGPGAWATHDEQAPRSRAKSGAVPPQRVQPVQEQGRGLE